MPKDLNTPHTSPLHHAVALQDLKKINQLLDAGADPVITNDDGKTPLQVAMNKGYWNCVEAIATHANDDEDQANGHALLVAMSSAQEMSHNPQKKASLYHKAMRLITQGACLKQQYPDKPYKGCTVLHFAIHAAQYDIIKMLLDRDINLNALNANTQTPLHLAVEFENLTAIELLLNAGADPTILNGHDKTPIQVAADKGYWNCVRTIAVHPTNKEDPANYGYALLVAMSSAQKIADNPQKTSSLYHAARILIAQGASLKQQHPDEPYRDYTPLHFAIEAKQYDIMTMLLDRNLDLNASNKHAPTPLHLAVACGDLKAIKLLLDAGADPTTPNGKDKTPIQVAADKGYWSCVRTIVAHPTDKDDKANYGHALLVAMSSAQKTAHNPQKTSSLYFIARLLIIQGASLNQQHPDKPYRGYTPLHFAIEAKQYDIMTMLLDHNLDLNALTEHAPTPLNLAVACGDLKAVKLLLEARVNPTTLDCNDKTPLHLAVKADNPTAIELLLDAGADPKIPNSNDKTPMQVAADSGYWNCVEAFAVHPTNKEDHANYGHALLVAMSSAQRIAHNPQKTSSLYHAARLLIAQGASLEQQHPDEPYRDYTPLHFAIKAKQYDIITMLLDRNLDLNAPHEHAPTPLNLAVACGDLKAIKLLLEAGADPKIPNGKDKTPIQVAADKGYWNCVEAIAVHPTNKEGRAKYGYALLVAMSSAQKIAHNPQKTSSLYHTARLLIAQGASLEQPHPDELYRDYTPLHFAITAKQYDIMTMLLDRNLDLNASHEHAPTPLNLAVACGDLKAIKLLLDAGANLTILHGFNEKALTLFSQLLLEAFGERNISLVLTLISARVTVDFSALSMPSTDEQWRCFRLLIGAALSEQLETVDWSPFYNAALRQKNERMKKELLLPQYDVDPLRAAFVRGDRTFVQKAVELADLPDSFSENYVSDKSIQPALDATNKTWIDYVTSEMNDHQDQDQQQTKCIFADDQVNQATHQIVSSNDDPGTIDFAKLPTPTTDAQWQCLRLLMGKTIQKKINTWPAFSRFYNAAVQQKNESATTFLLSPRFGIALSLEVAQSADIQKPRPSSSKLVPQKSAVLRLLAQENHWSKTEARARGFSGSFWVTPKTAKPGTRPKIVTPPALNEIVAYFDLTL